MKFRYIILFLTAFTFHACNTNSTAEQNLPIIDSILSNFYYSIKICYYDSMEAVLNTDTDTNSIKRVRSRSSNAEQNLFNYIYKTSIREIPCKDRYYFGKSLIIDRQYNFSVHLITGKNDYIEDFFVNNSFLILAPDQKTARNTNLDKTKTQIRIFDFLEQNVLRSSISNINISKLNFSQVFPNATLSGDNKTTGKYFEEGIYLSDILYNQDKTKAVVHVLFNSHQEIEYIYYLEKFGWNWKVIFIEAI